MSMRTSGRITILKRLLALFIATALLFAMMPFTATAAEVKTDSGTTYATQASKTVYSKFVEATCYDSLDHITFYRRTPYPADWPKDGGYEVSYYISKIQAYIGSKLTKTLYFGTLDNNDYNFNYTERNKSIKFVVTFSKRYPADNPSAPATFTDSITVKIDKGYSYSKAKTKKVKMGTNKKLQFKVLGDKYNYSAHKSSTVKITKGKVTLKVGKKTYKGKLKKGIATFKNVKVKRNSNLTFKLKGSNYWKNISQRYYIW